MNVSPELVTKTSPGGAGLIDHYHRFHLPDPFPGMHTAELVVRVLETNEPVAPDDHFPGRRSSLTEAGSLVRSRHSSSNAGSAAAR